MQFKSWFDLHHATPQGFDWVAGRGVVAQFFFPTDRSDLDLEDLDVANRLAAHLRGQLKTDRVELAIIGHADYRASIEYNKQLGMRRAKSVARALNGLLRTEPNFSLFSALSAGEQYAKQRALDEQVLARDRRVDVWSSTAAAAVIPNRLPFPTERQPVLQRLVRREYESVKAESWRADKTQGDPLGEAIKSGSVLILKKALGMDSPVPGDENIDARRYRYVDANFRVNVVDIDTDHYLSVQGGGKVDVNYTSVSYTWGFPRAVVVVNKVARHRFNGALKKVEQVKGRTIKRDVADKDQFFFPPPLFSNPE
jgi:OmpA family